MVVKYNMCSWSVDSNIYTCGSFVEVCSFISCLLSNFPCQSSHVFPWPISGPGLHCSASEAARSRNPLGAPSWWADPTSPHRSAARHGRCISNDCGLEIPFPAAFFWDTGQPATQASYNITSTKTLWPPLVFDICLENHPMTLWPFWEWCWLQTLCCNRWGYISVSQQMTWQLSMELGSRS